MAYWARKYGLKANGSEKFAARGAPDRAQLETLAAQGATLKEMGEALERSISTVRYWLARWNIDRVGRTRRVDPAVAPKKVERRCGRHGLTVFHLEGRGYYRCSRCRQEHVSSWRRRVKATLVREAGGRCRLCGYDRCQAALEFHHVDRADKVFAISHEGLTRSLESQDRGTEVRAALLELPRGSRSGLPNLRGLRRAARASAARNSPRWTRTTMT